MEKIRNRFCHTLKKTVFFVDKYEILKNGNGRDKAIGKSTCSQDCPRKRTCKFSRILINYSL